MPFFGRKKAKSQSAGEDNTSVGTSTTSATAANSGAQVSTGPGVVRAGANTSTFRVTIPTGVKPGQPFSVNVGRRVVRVRCPPNSRGGQVLQITIPVDQNGDDNATNINNNSNSAQPEFADTVVPPNVRPGDQFTITHQGREINVTCPPGARPGAHIRIDVSSALSPSTARNISRPPENNGQRQQRHQLSKNVKTQRFEVVIPKSARGGEPFALIAGGQRVLITCPPNATPGQKIRFALQISLDEATKPVRFLTGRDGWTRTLRVSDNKLQWIRLDSTGKIVSFSGKTFDVEKSAYVRSYNSKSDTFSLVSASEGSCESTVVDYSNPPMQICGMADLAEAQAMSFDEKVEWFYGKISRLIIDWNQGHMQLNVRREHLLEDSMASVMGLSPIEMRKIWRFEFIGEEGVDAGGLTREWFTKNSQQLMNPDQGLWMYSPVNQMCLMINPSSNIACEDDHLTYYRFLGRLMGKALFDRQIIACHMVRHLYKHLLGWPVTFADLEFVDEQMHKSLLDCVKYKEDEMDIEMLCLDFTTSREVLGRKEQIDLVENGSEIDVTNENLGEYLEAMLKYKMLDMVQEQTNALLSGFYDVIPEPLLTIFDFQELELLLCGKPEIDIDDWKVHTEYSGMFEELQENHHVVKWFWEIVEEFEDNDVARLLQFSTGTCGVPALGFSVLQGNDGNIRLFNLQGVSLDQCLYPMAHTCFNRIDLPLYHSKEDFYEKLKVAINLDAGFDME